MADQKTQIISSSTSNEVPAGTKIIGTYEIRERIAAGGMGEVYRGVNIHTDEPVAIKIVLPSLAHDQKIISLFQKEATVLSRLSHDAIVRYHVFTIDPEIKRPCLIMEFVDGISLARYIEGGRALPEADVRVLLVRLASGLAKAHRAGVIHRDLSPDNVVLRQGTADHATIIDFGIAKAASIGGGTLLGGQFAGKYNFVSPEQLGRFKGHVTEKSDIYSLGLVVAAASKGEVLDMGDSPAMAVERRMEVPDLTGVSDTLRPLLEMMLQPNPEQRPQSMDAIVAWVTALGGLDGAVPGETVGQVGSYEWQSTAAPRSQPPRSMPPSSMPPLRPTMPPNSLGPRAGASESDSPFGSSAPRATSAVPVAPVVAPRSSGAGIVIGVLLLGLVGVGGYFSYSLGLIPGVNQKGPDLASNDPPEVNPPDTPTPAIDTVDPVPDPAPPAEVPVPPAEVPTPPVEPDPIAEVPPPPVEPVPTPEVPAPPVEPDPTPEVPAPPVEPDPPANPVPEPAPQVFDRLASDTSPGIDSLPGADPEPARAVPAPPMPNNPPGIIGPADDAGPKPDTAPAAPPPRIDPAEQERLALLDVARRLEWLRDISLPPCSLVSVVSASIDRTMVDGYATSVEPFVGVLNDFRSEFGVEPDINVRLINNRQCAVINFIRNLPKLDSVAPVLRLEKELFKPGEAIRGTVEGINGRQVWIMLTDANGATYDLSPLMRQRGDGTTTFGLALKPSTNVAKGSLVPQLIAVIVSDKPLQSARVPSGTTADSLMPIVAGEVSSRGMTVSAAIAYFRFDME